MIDDVLLYINPIDDVMSHAKKYKKIFFTFMFFTFPRSQSGKRKEDLYRKLGIFILPIVSDLTNVFIVT